MHLAHNYRSSFPQPPSLLSPPMASLTRPLTKSGRGKMKKLTKVVVHQWMMKMAKTLDDDNNNIKWRILSEEKVLKPQNERSKRTTITNHCRQQTLAPAALQCLVGRVNQQTSPSLYVFWLSFFSFCGFIFVVLCFLFFFFFFPFYSTM